MSGNKYLRLNLSTQIDKGDCEYKEKGTSVVLENLYPFFSQKINSSELLKELVYEFGWFLKQNSNYEIIINSIPLDVDSLIEKEKIFSKEEMPEDIKEMLDEDFLLKIVVWKEKLSEYSKFYFLNERASEIFKQNTGMNKKKDCFWHSVYIKTALFDNEIINEDEENSTLPINAKASRIIKSIKEFSKEQLVLLRKPLLVEKAGLCISEMKKEGLLPSLPKYGIYDETSFDDLLKTVYTISPSSFVGKSGGEKKFFCATLASLLASQEDDLIPVLLEEIQNLTEEERKELLDILKRTTLSNVVKTIKEIDHRLDVIEKLKELLFIHVDDTLEVKHLQKILDENFWIFGEQFRLFSTTEGPLHQTLKKYAKDILGIDESELSGKSRKELDLFLTKTELNGQGAGIQRNIIVELKRPNITLGKEQYDQIEKYMETIKSQPACNGVNQYWEFYLIGDDYNEHIEDNNIHLSSDNKRDISYLKKVLSSAYVDWNCNNDQDIHYIKNKPESLPANGGNADTVGGYSKSQLMKNIINRINYHLFLFVSLQINTHIDNQKDTKHYHY